MVLSCGSGMKKGATWCDLLTVCVSDWQSINKGVMFQYFAFPGRFLFFEQGIFSILINQILIAKKAERL